MHLGLQLLQDADELQHLDERLVVAVPLKIEPDDALAGDEVLGVLLFHQNLAHFPLNISLNVKCRSVHEGRCLEDGGAKRSGCEVQPVWGNLNRH